MNGAHDMGGMHGFGPVEPEPNEPVFHAEWERRAFALTLAMGACGEWNIDMSRFAREDRPPVEYLEKTYYELWAAGTERLVLEHGLVGADEIAAGQGAASGKAGAARAHRRRSRQGAGARRADRPSGGRAGAL